MSVAIETVQTAVSHLSVAYQDGGNPQQTAQFYSNWAKDNNYEAHLNRNLYRGPEMAAQSVADYFPTSLRKDTKILDVAAGTGFVSESLRLHGFENIDALDPSEGMLEIAREKSLYNHYMTAYLDDNKLPTLEDTYDCAVTSGGMGEGHIPYNGLDQLIRVVRPGGLVCIVMREEYLNHSQYRGLLEPHMSQLEEQGYWVMESRDIVPNYCFDLNGIIYKFRVCDYKTK